MEDVDEERYMDLDSDEELLFDMDEDEREEHLGKVIRNTNEDVASSARKYPSENFQLLPAMNDI